MKPFSVRIRGYNGGTEVLENMRSLDTVEILKKKIYEVFEVNIADQDLVYKNAKLTDNEKTLGELGFDDFSIVYMFVQLQGGD